MADIDALATSAKKKLDHGDAIYPIDAARKAINGVGIFYKPDVERLKKRVLARMSELKRKEKSHVRAHR